MFGSGSGPSDQIAWSPTVWRKSSRSGSNGECVELAEGPEVVAIRDSKDPDGVVLLVSVGVWRDFIRAVRRGMFDDEWRVVAGRNS